MQKRYYFDTSIWLDFFEDRDEPNLPKGEYVKSLIKNIIKENGKIIYSEAIKNEMLVLGYSRNEIENLFLPHKRNLIYIYTNKKQFGKAKDISQKRNLPLFDAFHAILARDNKAILITRDKHFNKLTDICKYKKPEDFI